MPEDPLFISYVRHDRSAKAICTYTAATWFGTADAGSGCSTSSRRHLVVCRPGWITGHSYIIYSPLAFGRDELLCTKARRHTPYPGQLVVIDSLIRTSSMLHQRPRFRRIDALWRRRPMARSAMIEQFAPALSFRRRADQSRGVEVGNHRAIGNESCPIYWTRWWPRRSRAIPLITRCPEAYPLKPGSGDARFPGDARGCCRRRKVIRPVWNEEGFLVIKRARGRRCCGTLFG